MAFGGETAESFYDEGLTASMKGDIERAQQLFEKTIRLDRHFTAAYHQLAKCHLRKGEAERALQIARKIGRKNLILESQIVQGFIHSQKALWELKHLITPEGVNNMDAAQKYLAMYLEGLDQASKGIPEWELTLPLSPEERNRCWTKGPVEIIKTMMDEMTEVATELGIPLE